MKTLNMYEALVSTSAVEAFSEADRVKRAFSGDYFSTVSLLDERMSQPWHRMPESVRKLHCVHFSTMTPGEIRALRLFVVNYFLCPEATDPMEVEAWDREIFPAPQKVFNIFGYKLVISRGA